MALSRFRVPHSAATALLWVLRVGIGAVFIFSGWSKSVDLHGFCLKIEEYLTAAGMSLPQEIVLMGATGVATLEFVTGVLLATACLRRVAVWTAAAFMGVMLPLTIWTAVADPVSDCGCFGDLVVLSNTATLIKNVFISAGVGLLWVFNGRRRGLYPAPVQWLVIVATWLYPLAIGYTGYQTQPTVDFRPFKTGTLLFDTSEGGESLFVYSKGGTEKAFGLDALPDSTWSFVRTESDVSDGASIMVYDGDGEDCTEEFGDEISASPRALLLVVSDPEAQFMTRAHYLQELNDYLRAGGVGMYALVGAPGDAFDRWQRLTRPNFASYEAEDTSLKMLVRGSAGVVYLAEGRILWKRTLGSLSPELPYSAKSAREVLDAMTAIDDGRFMWTLTFLYSGIMLVLYALGLSPRMLSYLRRLTCGRKCPDDEKVCES